MALKTKMVIKLQCGRHPHYDPQRQGEAGIVGGCRACYAMLEVLPLLAKFRKVVDKLGETISANLVT